MYGADNFGGAIITSTLLIYWLHTHFHMTSGKLAVLYFGMDILSAASYPLAVTISRRIGLINTAVWTHLPCSAMLIIIPFLPTAGWVMGVFLVRSLLVDMDVPTRQSFIAAYVQPDERTAAAGATSIGEQAGQACGPTVGGLAFQFIGATLPFVVGGAIKVGYDLALWFLLRRKESDGIIELA